MGLLITKEEFVGKFRIGQNCYSELDEFIDKYEPQILQDLLGCDLYDLFIADLTDMIPVSQKYLDIYSPFCKDESSCIRRSQGMKDMLLGMVYFYFVRDLAPKVTTSGVKMNKVETSMKVDFGVHDIYSRYNESIETYCNIQWFIEEDESIYPEYNGQYKSCVSKI